MNRIATTLVTAGIAVLGGVALAPAASATTAADGASYVINVDRANGNGPDAFIVTENGRIPVFFCDDSGRHENKCSPLGDEASGRF
jgi:hypothetical protein